MPERPLIFGRFLYRHLDLRSIKFLIQKLTDPSGAGFYDNT